MERDWSSWDDSPRTVEEHIERYRETLAQKVAPAAAVSSQIEKEPDYFGDMEPTTIKQAKYLIASGSSNQQSENFTRLKATVQADIPISVRMMMICPITIKCAYKFNFIFLERVGGLG